VSREMFPGYEFYSITNGVHSFTWTCPSFRRLYDTYLPGWANEPELLVRVDNVPAQDLFAAHAEAKQVLLDEVYARTSVKLRPDVLTLGFARRATAYKRADLIFSDIERLRSIAAGRGLQIVFAGKAHPRDETGKRLIQRVISLSRELGETPRVVYLPGYDMALALKLVSGCDVWLNTPLRPHEASGTSGMKAAHNGVPNFSVLDGWWIEGHIEGVSGWSIGCSPDQAAVDCGSDGDDAADLYTKLQDVILPLFYDRHSEWIQVMRGAIGKNAYYFNTHRMMLRYATEAYLD
jgi:starch phosphorylase